MPGTDLCYIVSHGFAARMVLQSNVLPALKERGVRVTIALPDSSDATVRSIAEAHGIHLKEAPLLGPKMTFHYLLLRRYFFEDVRQNPALWSKHLAFLATEPWHKRARLRLYGLLNRLAVRFRGVRRLIARTERALLRRSDVASILRDVDPRVMVVTYPVEPLESLFLQEAHRAGIPTVGHLLSWDNITVKGRFAVPPDYYIAWGPIMSQEIQEYYGTPADRIYECGVAHFDHHFSAPDPAAQRAILKDLDLDPDRPYLFFGMSSPFVSPYEIEVVEWLAQAVEEQAFGPDLQLIVRPHPQNVQGVAVDESWLPRLTALNRHERVAVDFPALEDSKMMWSMKEEDLPHLSNLIAGCSICLNSGSTLSIDALIQDKPVIGIAFDAARTDVPWWKSAARTFTYRYMKTLTDQGGVSVVHSFEEMTDEIRKYLEDPSYRAEGRERARRQECGPSDGRASEHVAEALVDILKRARREASTMQRSEPVGITG